MNSPFVQISLHEQLADALRKEVQARPAGEKLESETALAKRFGVSALTAHQAMVLLAHEGLVVRRRGSGSFVADRPEPGGDDGRHIAVLIDRDISHPQLSYGHRRVSEMLLRFFQNRGLAVRRYTGRWLAWERDVEPTCEDFLQSVKAGTVRAAVLVATNAHPSWALSLRRRGAPIIGGLEDPYRVRLNYGDMVSRAVDYLCGAGRHKIALMEWHDSTTLPERRNSIHAAFEARLARWGLSVNDAWIRHDLHPATVGAGWTQFREIWSASREKPDGLIVTDDILFHDAATAICQLGIDVPRQLRVITHSNKGSGILCPFPVSLMESDPDQIAEAMGRMTLQRLAGEEIGNAERNLRFHWIPGDYETDGGETEDGTADPNAERPLLADAE